MLRTSPWVLSGLVVLSIGTVSRAEEASRSLGDPVGIRLPVSSGCAPVSGGVDAFPSTAKLVLDDNGFGEPYVIRLSSVGSPDATLQRAPQVGNQIDTEMLQMQLTGFHPRIGTVTLRESPSLASTGEIRDVVLNGSCQLADGRSITDLFIELDVATTGETWYNQDPIRLETRLFAVPPKNAEFEIPFSTPVILRDSATNNIRGEILYALHHADPTFPPAGSDCYDSLFTANLFVNSSGSTVGLVGFGPTRVLRGAPIPGGTCVLGGAPCQTDLQCPGLSTCRRQRIDTETVKLDLGGFDALLGSWSLEVRPAGGTSNCCVANGTPGCTDATCEALICGMDPYCCNVIWDVLCASLADSQPACVDSCPNPDAAPTLGTVKSVNVSKSYPANASFGMFVRIETALKGEFRNDNAFTVAPVTPLTNLPPNPQTSYVYGTPQVTMFDDDHVAVGKISNVSHQIQTPVDCVPPPTAGQECYAAATEIELTLGACSSQMIELTGPARVLRDSPGPGSGFGQDRIDTLLAEMSLAGTSPCSGSLTLRLSSTTASTGAIESLTPEEFFPAGSFFDVRIELDTPGGTLTAGPATLAATLNALPPASGERYSGPTAVLDLLNDLSLPVGEIRIATQEILNGTVCAATSEATIRFPGPTKNDLALTLPLGGAGVEYDLLRGELSVLSASGGAFTSATCLASNIGASFNDPATPPAGEAYYYVARDGFGAFNGSFNGTGPAQQGNRDQTAPACP